MSAGSIFNDLKNLDGGDVLLAPVSLAADGQSAGKDFAGTEGYVTGLLNVGVLTTFTAFDAKLQESDDNSTNWTDMDGGGFAQVTASQSRQLVRAKRTKRYVRLFYDVTGTPGTVLVACNALARKKISGTGIGYA